MNKFWMVCRVNSYAEPYGRLETGHEPKIKHRFEPHAVEEAIRLARLSPGDSFVVLEAMDALSVESAPVSRHTLT